MLKVGKLYEYDGANGFRSKTNEVFLVLGITKKPHSMYKVIKLLNANGKIVFKSFTNIGMDYAFRPVGIHGD